MFLDIVDRIQLLIKGKLTISGLEKQLGLGNGIIGKWKKQNPTCDKIIKVANYLNTSTDYLLGLTENPNISNDVQVGTIDAKNVSGSIIGGNVSGSTINNGGFTATDYNEQEIALINIFRKFDVIERAKLLSAIAERLETKDVEKG